MDAKIETHREVRKQSLTSWCTIDRGVVQCVRTSMIGDDRVASGWAFINAEFACAQAGPGHRAAIQEAHRRIEKLCLCRERVEIWGKTDKLALHGSTISAYNLPGVGNSGNTCINERMVFYLAVLMQCDSVVHLDAQCTHR